ncbi:malonyl CoA-ACP transacylase [Legionella beliardensis]|uniref:Malonyl CoA-acyl carrier protein transacylase n=1 Tax=Legionella beliardensis TaxID=91822 RepID=A0A378I1A6_9GAMM|nr:ACP S-malonyltransferase [Legionella beliardensis]STX28968.1 malonyl CoA-ACP transacylase [Legionella beliardensis]
MTECAFVFPGQGSQSIGMLAELARNYPIIEETFAIASQQVGYDTWDLVQHGPENKLNQTENTQVIMLAADVAIYNLLRAQELPQPKWMAGHSLGEYAALVCAGALSLPHAVKLVAKRGQLMQETIPLGQGAMAAIIGLTDEVVHDICSKVSTPSEQVSIANYNTIGQVVIAGHSIAVEKAITEANNRDARLAKLIPVSVPCHCSLLEEAAMAFKSYLDETPIFTPAIKVISNVDLSCYESPEQIRSLLKEQLYKPVRWVETIQMMQKKGVSQFIECGPGKVLAGLIKRIDKSLAIFNTHDKNSLNHVVSQLQTQEN